MTTIINCETGEVTTLPTSEEDRINEAWETLRANRNSLLSGSDWTQITDAPVNKEAWVLYRQDLRDLPANTVDPFNPIWPSKPE